ncbi:exonuclease SbcCD subunit D [Loigolactobacillus backii]|uniref:Nuclease SbcCD subunit D n=1 Tax=Loigolactobacillus backii TaxID=375175 RepID=A0A192H3A7_9LACO|nr:exonuclease SbcCD subunit D [Loigolactobacillus backii]ANK59330.1 exonuclease sbcCD subunit D [Loigolactobacillus backii]ANK62743.1 exonuclease sbcCD subunit D [Loigolactobacillus backii]ANK64322.1 exonuclease sbcCD subunit D [Loigolactobacillus backii]ANK67283.1 exonuclease sbcCD subunit D [Loigolactobacillus backii]ANK70249.1 exonuclease sbcCD subunit D [Loigolactobacillus backii]
MRFLHTADWHIGKKLAGYDLLAEQQFAYEQIVQLAKEEHVDAIVIAGDLYDRAQPSELAVKTLNEMLQRLNLTEKLPVLAISGNHDSATRLATGSPWYTATQFYLRTTLAAAFKPIEIGNTQFFLLPYFEPFAARQYFEEDDIHQISTAMKFVVAKMRSEFLPNKKHVLVAHFFAAGSSTTDSETKITVGGLDAVPLTLLTDFDYVALGHLHSKDALHAEKIRYSGSPVKFSISEADQEKGVWIVDTESNQVDFHPLKPLHDVRTLKASFAELSDSTFYKTQQRDDFLAIQLTDQKIIPNVMQELRKIYPRIVSLTRTTGPVVKPQMRRQIRKLDPLTLLANYFTDVTGEQLTEQQQQWATKMLKASQEQKEDN